MPVFALILHLHIDPSMASALILFRGVRCGASSTLRASVCKVRSYHDNVIDHYENPRNVGSLDKNVKIGSPRCCLCADLWFSGQERRYGSCRCASMRRCDEITNQSERGDRRNRGSCLQGTFSSLIFLSFSPLLTG